MALDFGDHASGFRHNDVIRFINNEVLMNGGGPEFYIAFRSRPWSEVEDRLQTVVSDPQVPRTIKRACAWSALALSVRIVARQQEQQAYRVRRLQEQVEEWEAATWALVAELQQTRDEREEMAAQLRFTQAALQQALNECDVLRGRLLQAERLAQATSLAHTVPGSQPEQHGSVVWPPNFDQPRDTVAMGGPGRLYFEAQVPAPTAVLHVPGPSGPWAQAVQPPQPMPVLFPFPPPFLVGVPCLQAIPTAVVMETEAVVVPSGTYPLVPWTTAGLQGMIPLWDLDNNIQEGGPEILQGSAPLGDSISHNHQEDQEGSQGLSFLRDSGCHNQESDLKRPQGTTALGISGSCNQEKGPERPQGMAPIGNRESQSLEEDLERPHETVSLGDSWSQSQEETLEKPPETGPLGESKIHGLEKVAERAQRMAPWGFSRSQSQEENAEKAQRMPPPRFSRSHNQEKGAERAQRIIPWGFNRSQRQEENAEKAQRMAPPRFSRSHNQEEGVEKAQRMAPWEFSRSQSQEENAKETQGMAPPRFSRSHNQEGAEKAQRMVPWGVSRSQSQEEDSEMPQATFLEYNKNHDMRENSKKHQPQGQKAKQPKGRRTWESQHQERPVPGRRFLDWDCSRCRAWNYSWRTACYKCKKVRMPIEHGDFDPGQTH